MANSAIVGVLRALLVADTATFERGFKDSAVVATNLGNVLKDKLAPQQRAINNLTQAFLGGNEIRKAKEYAAAIEAAGGVTQLTAKHQEKANKVIGEALNYYRALGVEAPANLQKIFDQTTKTEKSTSLLGGAFGRMTAAFTAAGLIDRAIGGLIDLGKSAFVAAGHIVDLSQKTGLSTTAVQKYGFVANQTGGTVDNFADTIFKMGVNIEKGGDAVTRGLGALNLEYSKIKSLKPEDQFDAIMRALAGIESPQERNRIGVELMGKAYSSVAASVEDYISLIEKAPVASEAAVKASDDAADAIGRAWDKAKTTAINAIGAILLGWEKAKKELDAQDNARSKMNASRTLANTFSMGEGASITLTDGPTEPSVKEPTERMGHWRRSIEQVTAALETDVQAVEKAEAELRKLTAAQRAEIDAGLKRGETIEQATAGLGLGDDALRLYTSSVKESTKATKDNAKAQEDATERAIQGQKSWNDRVAAISKQAADTRAQFEKDQLSEAQGRARLIAQAFIDGEKKKLDAAQRIGKQIAENFIETSKIEKEADDLTRKRTMSTTAYQIDQIQRWARETKAGFVGTKEQAEKFYAAIDRLTEEKLAALKTGWRGAVSSIAAGFQQLATISGDSMSRVTRSIGSTLTAFLGLDASIQKINEKNEKGNFSATNIIGGIVGVLGNVGQIFQIVNAFLTPEWRRAMRHVGEEWGVEISQATAQAIADTEKELITSRGDTRDAGAGLSLRGMAELLNLQKVIADAGGLTSKNLDTWIGRSRELFDVIALGGKKGTLATKELSGLITAFTEQASKSGGLWSQAFRDLINEAKSAGLAVEQVTAAFEAQFEKIRGGTNAITAGVIKTSEEFDRLNRITLAAFNAYIAQGHSAAEAADFFGGSIDALIAKQKEFGFQTGSAFDELSRMRQLVSANQPLLDQVAGLHELLAALSNVGALTTETFADIQAQGQQAFNRLIEAGFTEREALAQIAPLLSKINDLRNRGEIAIDDQTAALIEQAKGANLIKDQVTEAEALEAGFNKVEGAIVNLGKTLGEVFGRVAKDIDNAIGKADQLGRTLGGIPSGSYAAPRVPKLGGGGIVTQPTYAMVGEAGPEAVIPLSQLPGSDGNNTFIFEVDGRRLAEVVVPKMPDVMRRLRLA